MMIDEEISYIGTVFKKDLKQMRKTLDNYQARKQDIPTEEKAERDAVIETLRKAWIAFEIKMEQ
jgi:hypothetical protein